MDDPDSSGELENPLGLPVLPLAQPLKILRLTGPEGRTHLVLFTAA
ncbi:MAG: hypothetical protein HYZ90_05450 [Candidatus Omnitrophica bacterium]|nr:hypothetical protein [Candidatus Omnitrophota bacterium]